MGHTAVKELDTPIYRELIALHAILETLGIPTEDIFVSHGNMGDGKYAIQVVIKREGQFVIDVAEVDTDAETFKKEWLDATNQYNASSQEDRTALMEGSETRKQAARLAEALVAKGLFGQGTN